MKIGDKLKCVDDRGSNSLNATNDYKIVAVNIYDNIQVKELDYPYDTLAHFYKPERFMLVEEKMEIDFNKKYKTRGGQKVNLLCYSKDRNFSIVGEIEDDGGEWTNETWSENGKFLIGEEQNELDLVEVKDMIVDCGPFTVEVFDDGGLKVGSGLYILKDEAKEIFKLWSEVVDK